MQQTIERSQTYRSDYINAHPGIAGFYICAYCGRIITRKHMQVDHVIAVHRAKKSMFYRRLVKNGESLNNLTNMVAACAKCNKRKSDKGGLWVIRGIIGPYIWPVIWILLIAFLLSFLVYVCTHPFTHIAARNMIFDIVQHGINCLVYIYYKCLELF